MRPNRLHKLLLAFALLALVTGAPALAEEAAPAAPDAVPTAEVAPELERTAADIEQDAKLMERAKAYWTARVARDPKVLEFYPPPEKLPEELRGSHGEGGALSWQEFEIEAVRATGDEGLVQVRTKMDFAGDLAIRLPHSMRKALEPTVMEPWILVDGVWYKRPIKPGLSRMMQRDTTTCRSM